MTAFTINEVHALADRVTIEHGEMQYDDDGDPFAGSHAWVELRTSTDRTTVYLYDADVAQAIAEEYFAAARFLRGGSENAGTPPITTEGRERDTYPPLTLDEFVANCASDCVEGRF